MRKKLCNLRKKIKIGQKHPFKMIRSSSYACGLSKPINENIADLIYNIYGNKAEELINKKYKEFIAEKNKRKFTPSSSPRYISPKVKEMKRKEEERKANLLSDINIYEKEKPVLYKLKMFQNVGSKVTEGIKKFKTFKPIMYNNKNVNRSIINEVQNDIKKKEQIDLNL